MPPGRRQADKTRTDRVMQAFAQTRLGGYLFITVFPAIDKRLMPLTKGRLRIGMGQPMLLLHTFGAKSNAPRVTPLLYTPGEGDDLLVVASKAGAPGHPAWFHNVMAHADETEIEIGGRRRPVHAREAQGEERDRLWARVNDYYSGYDTYQERAGQRRIPVVVLEPR